MKKFLFILACAFAIVCCGQKNNVNVNDNDNTPRSTLNAQHSTLNTPRSTNVGEQKVQEELTSLIKTIYAEIANQNGETNNHACHTFIQLEEEVNKIDENLEDIGFFNEHIYTQMQDTEPDDIEVRNIKFEQMDVEKGTALASFEVRLADIQNVRMKFAFCREDGEWRVHDIIKFYIDADEKEAWGSYLEGMKNYVEEMKQQ
jgi:hypothetical protein